jgi:hypothetical protein
MRTDNAADPSATASDEGAVTGKGAPDDESVHLAGSFIGVDGLGVGNEATDVVIQQDSIATEQLAGPSD